MKNSTKENQAAEAGHGGSGRGQGATTRLVARLLGTMWSWGCGHMPQSHSSMSGALDCRRPLRTQGHRTAMCWCCNIMGLLACQTEAQVPRWRPWMPVWKTHSCLVGWVHQHAEHDSPACWTRFMETCPTWTMRVLRWCMSMARFTSLRPSWIYPWQQHDQDKAASHQGPSCAGDLPLGIQKIPAHPQGFVPTSVHLTGIYPRASSRKKDRPLWAAVRGLSSEAASH